jgi:SAM-dependent methyltransferase
MTMRPIKRLADGRALLNLGCGTRMHLAWNNVDSSPYALLARHRNLSRALARLGVLSAERQSRLAAVDPKIVRWDLRKGIPFPADSIDVVYHSHVLEHFDRDDALRLLAECHRVLRPGGILRVVVPDLLRLVTRYQDAVTRLKENQEASADHERAIEALFDQMVRRLPFGLRDQTGQARFLEQRLRPSAAAAGELHRWMYDRFSLARRLGAAGFVDISVEAADTSRISDWKSFGLDTEADGSPYKPGSLYVEAQKVSGNGHD